MNRKPNNPVTFLATLFVALMASEGLAKEWVVFDDFAHELVLSEFRAGSHDQDGTNEYFLNIELEVFHGNLPNEKKPAKGKKEDTEKEPEKVSRSIESKLQMEIKALDMFKPKDKDSRIIARVQGDLLRGAVAEAMHKWSLRESQLNVRVKISLFEENKKFFFFGDDQLIAEAQYLPFGQIGVIPSLPERIRLQLKDEKGTNGTIEVNFGVATSENKVAQKPEE